LILSESHFFAIYLNNRSLSLLFLFDIKQLNNNNHFNQLAIMIQTMATQNKEQQIIYLSPYQFINIFWQYLVDPQANILLRTKI